MALAQPGEFRLPDGGQAAGSGIAMSVTMTTSASSSTPFGVIAKPRALWIGSRLRATRRGSRLRVSEGSPVSSSQVRPTEAKTS
jgi:hypothetical protein